MGAVKGLVEGYLKFRIILKKGEKKSEHKGDKFDYLAAVNSPEGSKLNFLLEKIIFILQHNKNVKQKIMEQHSMLASGARVLDWQPIIRDVVREELNKDKLAEYNSEYINWVLRDYI